MEKNSYLTMIFKKIELFLFFFFLFANTSWAMHGGVAEEKNDSSKCTRITRDCLFESFSEKIYYKIFIFLSPLEIINLTMASQSNLEIFQAASRACSDQALYLADRDIAYSPSSSIKSGVCKNIRILDLSRCVFRSDFLKTLPETLIELSADELTGYLNFYSFIFEFLNVLPSFENLKKLSFRKNKISNGIITSIFISSRHLNIQVLNLGNNAIGSDGAHSISMMKQVTILDLSENKIGDVGAGCISKMTDIVILNLAKNSIGTHGVISISKMQKIKELNLSDNLIEALGASFISKMKQIQNLNLSRNKIGDIGAASISKMKQIQDLNLCQNLIQEDGAVSVSEMKQIQSLNLSRNNIGDNGAISISNMDKIEILRLSSNSIGFIGAAFISNMRKIIVLDLAYNIIGNEGGARSATGSNGTDLRKLGSAETCVEVAKNTV